MLGEIRRREQVRFGNAGWVIHPYWLDALTRLLTEDAQQQGWGAGLDALSCCLLAPDGRDGGRLFGFPYVVTRAATGRLAAGERTDIGDSDLDRAWIYFSSDWSEAWIGADPDVVAVDVSVDAHFQSDETVVRAVVNHDFLLRRPRFFIYADRVNRPEMFEDGTAGVGPDQAVVGVRPATRATRKKKT